MELVLSTLRDNALYLYQVLSNISYGFRVTDLNIRIDARVVANVDGGTYGRTDRRTDGKSDPYIAPCLRQARQKGVFKS